MRWIDRICRTDPPPARRVRAIRAGWASLVILTGAQTAEAAAAASGPLVLGSEQMDGVTAAGIRMDLELSATAQGPSAITSTQGSVTIGHTTAVRVAIDPSAPEQARARLLGTSDLEVGIAAGKADASGANDAKCSAEPTITGADYTFISRSQTFTALTATCSCTALAIGFLSH